MKKVFDNKQNNCLKFIRISITSFFKNYSITNILSFSNDLIDLCGFFLPGYFALSSEKFVSFLSLKDKVNHL